jgi:hypothetical protein
VNLRLNSRCKNELVGKTSGVQGVRGRITNEICSWSRASNFASKWESTTVYIHSTRSIR